MDADDNVMPRNDHRAAEDGAGPILCVGEVLWDILPSGTFLGGAPFNVACDLHQLGCDAAVLSRVGADELGLRVKAAMHARGMPSDLLQTDTGLPTGTVDVAIDGMGVPQYTINHPSAWDAIAVPDERSGALRPSVLVFGSLAQRSETTRRTIDALCARAAMRIFDVNLRAPYDDREVVRRSLERATVLKLNRHELRTLARWYGLPDAERGFCTGVRERFGCATVCITKDEDGASLDHEGAWFEHPGFRVAVKDTVGAGDAFLAGFLARSAARAPWEETLEYANLLGAFVASRDGATPVFSPDDVSAFRRTLR